MQAASFSFTKTEAIFSAFRAELTVERTKRQDSFFMTWLPIKRPGSPGLFDSFAPNLFFLLGGGSSFYLDGLGGHRIFDGDLFAFFQISGHLGGAVSFQLPQILAFLDHHMAVVDLHDRSGHLVGLATRLDGGRR